MKALKYNQYVYELMNNDHAVDELVVTEQQQWLNLDLTRVVHGLVDIREQLEAAGYRIEGTLCISGPLNVTIDL